MNLKHKRLYRSADDRMLAGVCSGVADYFEIDPTLIRLVFVILSLMGGAPGILGYIIMWIVMPERPAGATVTPSEPTVAEPAVESSIDAKTWAEEQLGRTEGVDPTAGRPPV